jgi:hypothetical protein
MTNVVTTPGSVPRQFDPIRFNFMGCLRSQYGLKQIHCVGAAPGSAWVVADLSPACRVSSPSEHLIMDSPLAALKANLQKKHFLWVNSLGF